MEDVVRGYLDFKNGCREMGWVASKTSRDYDSVLGLAYEIVDGLKDYKDKDVEFLINSIHNKDLEIVPFTEVLVARYKKEFEKLEKQPVTDKF